MTSLSPSSAQCNRVSCTAASIAEYPVEIRDTDNKTISQAMCTVFSGRCVVVLTVEQVLKDEPNAYIQTVIKHAQELYQAGVEKILCVSKDAIEPMIICRKQFDKSHASKIVMVSAKASQDILFDIRARVALLEGEYPAEDGKNLKANTITVAEDCVVVHSATEVPSKDKDVCEVHGKAINVIKNIYDEIQNGLKGIGKTNTEEKKEKKRPNQSESQ